MSRFAAVRKLSQLPRAPIPFPPATVSTPSLDTTVCPESGTPERGAAEKGSPDTSLASVRTQEEQQGATFLTTVQSEISLVSEVTAFSSPSTEEAPTKTPSCTAAPLLGAAKEGAPFLPAGLQPFRAKPRVTSATRVEHGHSLGEDRLYKTLYHESALYSGEVRIIQIGFKSMSRLTQMTVNNCRANTLSLIHKLALEEVRERTDTSAAVYLVYDMKTILKRRKEAGLTHVIRSRGVVFVDENTGREITPKAKYLRTGFVEKGTLQKGTSFSGGDFEKGAPPVGEKGAVLSDLYPYKEEEQEKPTTTIQTDERTSYGLLPPALLDRLEALVPALDQGAGKRIWNACREIVPDTTPEEVCHFFEARAQLVFRNRSLTNPLGLMLSSIPDWFTERKVKARRDQLREDAEVVERLQIEFNERQQA